VGWRRRTLAQGVDSGGACRKRHGAGDELLFFTIMMALGLVFQIPAVIFVLSRIGVVTARGLLRYFRHALLGCVIVAAIITPTTDFANMLVIAGPMIALYGVGIGVAWLFGKRRQAPDVDI
jgi:sec-independent protein translocase protein TatC